MRSRVLTFLRNYNIGNEQKFNTKLYTFITCVIIATVFWVLLSLGGNFNTKITLGIDYLNLPSDKTLINNLPKQFTLEINAKGFDLVSNYFNKRKLPITIDLSKINLNEFSKKEKEYEIATTEFTSEINKYLGDDIRIISVSPDTLKLNFSDLQTKKVPVNLNIKIKPRKQFDIKGKLKASPDSITISGTKEELDTINSVNSEREEFVELDKTISKMMNIEKRNNPDIFYSQDKIYVTIPIEKFTEKTFEIPLKMVNLKPQYNIKVLPAKVTISFMVAVSDYNTITEKLFNPVVDFKDFNPENDTKMKVSLSTFSDNIKSIQIDPPFVDYIIIK